MSRCINHFFVCVFCPLGKRQFCSGRIILRVWRGVLSVVRRSVFPCHYMPPHLHFTSIPRFYLILVGFYLKPFDKVSGQYFLDLSVSDGWRRGSLPRSPAAETTIGRDSDEMLRRLLLLLSRPPLHRLKTRDAPTASHGPR